MYHLQGFPPLALENIRMLSAFSKAFVVLSTGVSPNIEYVMAAPQGTLSQADKEMLEEMVERMGNIKFPDSQWATLPRSKLSSHFTGAQYARVDAWPLVGPTFLWLFGTHADSFDENCLLLMGQTRQSIEKQYNRFFYGKEVSNDPGGGDRFRLLFEFSPVGIFFYDTNMQITAFNGRFIDTLKTSSLHLRNLNLRTIKDLRIMPALEAPLNGEEGYYEGPYDAMVSKITINALLKTAPVLDDRKQVVGVIGIIQDNTERIENLRALSQSEERFRLVALHSNDVIYEWDPYTNLIHWYGNFAAIAGGVNHPRTFNEFMEIIHPADRTRVADAWNSDLKEGKHWHQEFRIVLENGGERYFKGSGIVLFNKGIPSKAYGTLTNVSNEKLLIQDLQEAIGLAEKNHARVTGLLAAIPDMIFVMDRDGYIRDYHTKYADKLYTPPSRFINRLVDDVLPPHVATLNRQKIAAVLAGKGIETYNYSLQINGKAYDYESRMVFIDNEHVLSIVRDVTRALALEKELIEAKEKAEESDRLKTAFIANMSHEIRTPMNSILGFAELLSTPGLLPEEHIEFTNLIMRNGQQLLRIINDVLEISRLESGLVKIAPTQVKLNDLINDLCQTFGYEAGQKGIHLEAEMPAKAVYLMADGAKLIQVFTNLIHNALKFTPKGGTVTCGFDEKGSLVLFFVKDTGIGIDAANHSKVFGRFMQVSKSNQGDMRGTGLGLPICKNLIELMGGKIWLESEPGIGTRFFFVIPRRYDE